MARDDDYDSGRSQRRTGAGRRAPVYEEEETIRAGKGSRSGKDRAIGSRRRNSSSSSSSTEEIRRAFPPKGYDKDRDRRRSKPKQHYDSDSYSSADDRHRRQKTSSRKKKYSSSSSSRSPSPRRKDKNDRRKSLGEQALGALGIGSAAAAALGGRSKSHDRSRGSRRDRRRYSSSSRSRSRNGRGPIDPKEQLLKVAKAAVLAGGTEAWRMRNEPGGWGGAKGKRVLTAAVGAAGVNKLMDKDGGKGGVIESVIGGLAGNRIINGSRSTERSRSRNRGRDDDRDSGGAAVGGLSAGALAAMAAKAFQSHATNKSSGRGRRSYSSSSDDARGGRYGQRRSKSVSDYMRQGLSKLGIGGNNDQRAIAERQIFPSNREQQNLAHFTTSQPELNRHDRDNSTSGFKSHENPGTSDSDTMTSISSTEDELQRKKLGRKQLVTAGLASVATIHAAHNIYQGYEAQKLRRKEVAKGDLKPSLARQKKNKARLQTAASVGIAALGVKGAYSEWKEVKERREEVHKFDIERKLREERRALRHHLETPTQHPHQSFVHTDQQSNASAYFHGPEPGSGVPDLSNDPNAGYYEGPSPHYTDGNPFSTTSSPPIAQRSFDGHVPVNKDK